MLIKLKVSQYLVVYCYLYYILEQIYNDRKNDSIFSKKIFKFKTEKSKT